MRAFAAVALVGLLLAGCSDRPAPAPDGDEAPADGGEAPQAVRWIAIGDMGTGEAGQQAVAAGMLGVCAAAGCDFVVGLGDNIYEAGVSSPYDPQFALKFEQPYAGFDVPFHMTLGNHDNGGVQDLHSVGDLQVAYAARTDRAMNLWVMPDRWYEHQHGPVRFLALDTNVVFTANEQAPGTAATLTRDVDGVAQMAWLRERLQQPGDATWTFTHGHHPVFSNGVHGDAERESPPLGAWLLEALCQGGVDAALSGHDHDLQMLGEQQGCPGVEHVVSGAAAQVRDITAEPRAALFSCGSTLGFAWMQVEGEVLTTRLHAADGTLLFERVRDRADPARSTATVVERVASCTPD